MNFYKHHLGDYDGHTAHLSWDEDMAYTRLMRSYYRREAPIPDAEKYRLTRAVNARQRAAVDIVLSEFFRLDGGTWKQKRCDEEIAAYQAQASTNRRIARERTVPRTVDEPLTNHTPNQNQIPEPDTRTKNQKPERSRASTASAVADAAKDEIWQSGRALLETEGKSRDAAGSFLGKLCKDYGQVLVLQAVRDCNVAVPAKPSEWLIARCQERRGNGHAGAVAEAKRRIFGQEKDITDESTRL